MDLKSKKHNDFLQTTDLLTVILKTLFQEEVIKRGTYDDILKCIRDLRNFEVTPGDILVSLWESASPFNPNVVSLTNTSTEDRIGRQIVVGDAMIQIIKHRI